MIITVNRAENPRKGTYWRPVEHSVSQRRNIEKVRRVTPERLPDKTISRTEDIQLDQIDRLLTGSDNEYNDARIEDPYKRGHYIDGYIYIRSLAAFVHEDEVERIEANKTAISPGVIISKAVRIDEGVHLSPYVEIEGGVKVSKGTFIGENTVLRKGSRVGENAQIGGHAYVGQFSVVGKEAVIGSISLIERRSFIGNRVQIGRQGSVGVHSHVSREAWMDDSVSIGREVYIGGKTAIGEMTFIGSHSHIGDTAMVGAESRLGRFVRVAKGVILVSPTVACEGEVILTSNLFAPRSPEQ